MKRVVSILLCIVIALSLAVTAHAADEYGVYTSESSFVSGGTVTVDKGKTLQNIYSNSTSERYNAYLEGFANYTWYRNDSEYRSGESVTLTNDDMGCQMFCRIYLFEDAEKTKPCGEVDCPKFTVPNTGRPAPTITTKSLPNATVGTAYYQKLECTDPDVVYSLFRSSLPDGLNLTQHGEIEGTPTKAGFYYVVIMVRDEFGEENTEEFEFTVTEGPQHSMEVWKAPNKVVYKSGEKLDMTGLHVRVYGPDGYLDSMDGKYLTYTDQPLVTPGEQKIKLTYEDAFTFVIVTVVAAEDTTEPTGTTAPATPTEITENAIEEENEAHDSAVTMEPSAGISLGGITIGVVGIVLVILAGLVAALLFVVLVIVLIIVIIKKKKKKKPVEE